MNWNYAFLIGSMFMLGCATSHPEAPPWSEPAAWTGEVDAAQEGEKIYPDDYDSQTLSRLPSDVRNRIDGMRSRHNEAFDNLGEIYSEWYVKGYALAYYGSVSFRSNHRHYIDHDQSPETKAKIAGWENGLVAGDRDQLKHFFQDIVPNQQK